MPHNRVLRTVTPYCLPPIAYRLPPIEQGQYPADLLGLRRQDVGQGIGGKVRAGGDLGTGAEGTAREVADVDETEVPMAHVQVGQGDALNRNVKPALFAQLASQRLVGAFPAPNPSAGQAPGMPPAVGVLEKEHPAVVVEDERRRSS